MIYYPYLYNTSQHFMQKQLKSLDRQLKNNSLIRIPDSTQKHQYSLFRALSMAVFYSHQYHSQIATEIKLTLASNLGEKRNIAFPIIHQNPVLKKYLANPELIIDFWQNPDLNCFHNDILIIASAAFGKVICVYTLDKDEYLNEYYISACKNPQEQKLHLGKAGKKYYAILPATTHQILPFIKQNIVQMILGSMFEQQKIPQIRQDRIHYPNFDEVVTNRHSRQHKKSLSDCGDIPLQIQPFEQRKYEQSSDRGSYQPINKIYPTVNINNEFEQDPFESGYTQYSIDNNNFTQQSLTGYYGYNYYGYTQDNNFSYIQSASPINNQRYAGRLKFFDQNGNYGFIVIDNMNIDLFVHYDDLSKAGINKQKLISQKNNFEMRFYFTYYQYQGKQHKKSKKAVDLQLIQE